MTTQACDASRSAIVWTMRLLVLVPVLAACDSPSVCTRDHRGGYASDHRACSLQFDAAVGEPSGDEGLCNPFTQTGCNAGTKCTWIIDTLTPQPLGHKTCVPDGVKAIGESCAFGLPGATTGYDDCVKGAYCANGTCAAICDVSGGYSSCDPTHACVAQAHAFEYAEIYFGGVCEPTCDPLADNDFLGSGQRGSGCPVGQGCYGPFDARFACAPEGDPSLVHRSACGSECVAAPALDGCAQGYVPLVADSTGSTQIDCMALCRPGNTYLGNPGTQYPTGQAPHTCTTTDARGTFDTGSNGDQCSFSWAFEYDSQGHHILSSTSDTVGFCIDHSTYRYDSNNDGMLNGSDAVWPPCDSLGIGSNVNNGFDATFFGCVDTATATANGHPPALRRRLLRTELRLPYRGSG